MMQPSRKMRGALVAMAVSFVLDASGIAGAAVSCPGGRFVVDGGLMPGDAGVRRNTIVVARPFVSVESHCGPVSADFRVRRTGTSVRATWAQCGEGARGIRLLARIDPTCTTMAGSIVGGERERSRRFSATRAPREDRMGRSGGCDAGGCDGSPSLRAPSRLPLSSGSAVPGFDPVAFDPGTLGEDVGGSGLAEPPEVFFGDDPEDVGAYPTEAILAAQLSAGMLDSPEFFAPDWSGASDEDLTASSDAANHALAPAWNVDHPWPAGVVEDEADASVEEPSVEMAGKAPDDDPAFDGAAAETEPDPDIADAAPTGDEDLEPEPVSADCPADARDREEEPSPTNGRGRAHLADGCARVAGAESAAETGDDASQQ